MTSHSSQGFHGPKLWVITALLGLAIGAGLTFLFPAQFDADHHAIVPLWLVTPFALLLGSIALMPFINVRFWHHHFPDFAFLLGGITVGYYLMGYSEPDPHHPELSYGSYHMLHAALEYYSFIALVGGLYIVSGTILVDLRGYASPGKNTLLMAFGAVIANLVGTTGASMLLIRPFMRVNKGRLMPIHIVFFIFIVSNCGGLLTPVGDPPLYLGFLKGVPFTWTLTHLWKDWILVIGCLLVMFYLIDRYHVGTPEESTLVPLPAEPEASSLTIEEVHSKPGLHIRGGIGLLALGLMIFGVFIDPLLKTYMGISGYPIGATFQIIVATSAYFLADRKILKQNDFNFMPVKEVGLLFLGIFATMVPALAYIAHHGKEFGIESASTFYFGTGALSAFLDNAPTYLNFLQLALGEAEMIPDNVAALLSTPAGHLLLSAISTGAVFFGAMTYIGNGPNFMVKAIAESEGVRMPSFITYMILAIAFLFPILVLHWAVFI
jgi:Na+/H+ antiporter NhaD/arsenite permease-like protein